MMEGKAAVCRLTGPIDFKFGWKGNTTITPVMGNEKAIVRVDGTKAFCEMNMAD